VSYERMFTDLFGLEFGVAYSNHDVDLEVSVEDGETLSGTAAELSITPVLLGANFHLLRKESVELLVPGEQTN
jgi:hypothetical protein